MILLDFPIQSVIIPKCTKNTRVPSSQQTSASRIKSQKALDLPRLGRLSVLGLSAYVGNLAVPLLRANKALPGLGADPSLGGARARLLGFGETLQAYPDAAQALRERGSVFGILKGSPLARVLADQQPARAITGLMNGVEKTMRDHLKQVAEREATQALERSLSRGRGHGMSR